MNSVFRWSTLEIHAKHGVVPDDELAYVAGYAEGMQTGELIYMMYKNTLEDDICPPDSKSNFCNQLLQFIDDNQIFMKEEIRRNRGSSYWYQVIDHVTILIFTIFINNNNRFICI